MDNPASYDETLIKLANAEQQVEDLKNQLDDALSAEDMVVRLTERNLVLGEVKSSSDLSQNDTELQPPENRRNANYYRRSRGTQRAF